MSLLTIDLSKVKKLSLKGVRLPIKDKEPKSTNYPPLSRGDKIVN
jgi:hypothetical protein